MRPYGLLAVVYIASWLHFHTVRYDDALFMVSCLRDQKSDLLR